MLFKRFADGYARPIRLCLRVLADAAAAQLCVLAERVGLCIAVNFKFYLQTRNAFFVFVSAT